MRWMIAVMFFLLPMLAVAADAPDKVVVIRSAHDPVLVWDATPTIYALVGNAATDREINTELERGALRVTKSKQVLLNRSSGKLTVRVVYQANITPHGTNYQDSTLGTATTYALFEMPLPRGAQKFLVVGKLPGR